jgi:hypothetical protein
MMEGIEELFYIPRYNGNVDKYTDDTRPNGYSHEKALM